MARLSKPVFNYIHLIASMIHKCPNKNIKLSPKSFPVSNRTNRFHNTYSEEDRKIFWFL